MGRFFKRVVKARVEDEQITSPEGIEAISLSVTQSWHIERGVQA
jgi:hypothetical protein